MLAWKLGAVTGIFLNSCKFLKQEGTGNVLESIKRAKEGVHISKKSMSVHFLNLNFCSSEISGPFPANELPFEKC